MAVPNSKSDDVLLKNLVPLNTLSDEQLGHLLSQIAIEKAKKGDYLFREGDTDHQNIYLLSGTVALLSGQKEMDLISSGTPTARFALAHQLPRKHSAQARTAVSYVRIDSRMLSDMLARSHSASYEVNEIEQPSSDDWMSLLLQSPVFQQIPPANLQRVMMRMEEIEVSEGDIIINQGDEGDYFYLISRGECVVSRVPEQGHAPVELARLKAGRGFGEEALISDKPRSSSVVMGSDGILVRLNKQDFIELVKQPLSHPLTFDEAQEHIAGGALWLDVRSPEDYEEGHLPGAINLPFFSLRFQASSLSLDRAYVVYGEEVGQAATAAYLLTERGAEVFVVDTNWSEVASKAGLNQTEDGAPVCNVIDFNQKEKDAAHGEGVEGQRQMVNRLQDELSEVRQSFEEELNQRRTEIRLLRQALAVAKSRLESEGQEVQASQELQLELDALKEKLAQAESRVAEHETHAGLSDELQARVNDLEQRLAASQEALDTAHQATDEARQRGDELLQQLTQQQSRFEASEGQLKEQITELQFELENLREASHSESDRNEQYGAEIEALKTQVTALEDEARLFRQDSEQALDEITRERDALLDAQAETESRQQQLSEQLAELNQSHESLRQSLETVEARNQELSDELDQANASNVALNETQQQLEGRLQETSDALEQARQEQENLNRSLQEQQEALSQAENHHQESLQQQQNEHRQLVEDLNGQIETLTQNTQQVAGEAAEQLASLKQVEQDLQQQLEAATAAQAKLSEERDQWQGQFQQEEARAQSLQAQLDTLEAQRSGLDFELEQLRQQSQETENAHQEQLAALQLEMQQVQAEHERLQRELEQQSGKLAERETALQNAEDERIRTQESLEVWQRESGEAIERLEQQLANSELERDHALERETQLN
jgi:CRP-like cAMP-binding protein/predicted  nucleic acid-binding Zn-ribbon protein